MRYIHTNSDARIKLLNGINAVADIVKTTLGPCGSNVILKSAYNVPTIINDGVSIAKEIVLEDPTENAGATLLTSAASATNSSVGDGTTTTCILTQEIIKGGFEAIDAGINPILLRESLKKVAEECIYPQLEERKDSCDSLEKLQNVATISVGGNEKYGKLVAEALNKVGVEGIVNLENNMFPETALSIIDGYKIDRGYMSPYAINNTDKFIVDYENCLVLCCYHKITEGADVEPLFNYAHKSGKSILLIVEDIDESIFGGLQVNLMRKVFRICPVKSPGFGFNVRDYMNDIAKMTGCVVYADDTRKMRTFTPDDFGFASKVIATREYTSIIRDPEASKEELNEYVKSLRNQLDNTENEHLRDSLKERISKLTVGVATISVGAQSQAEQLELKLRLEDAINATRAALQGGILPGGGSVLMGIATTLKNQLDQDFPNKEDRIATKILSNALEMPLVQIINNCGYSDRIAWDSFILECLENPNLGFNGKTRRIEDLKEAGVIDPALVVKSAVENAVSIASIILTTQATIIAPDKAE